MFDLKPKNVIAIVRSNFFQYLTDGLEDDLLKRKIRRRKWKEITDAEFDLLNNSLIDSYIENSPVVYERYGRGDFGQFPIQVKGIRGAYFCWAPDFGYEGPFSTKAEAISKTGYFYG